MNLQGSYQLAVPQAEVWRALNDPAILQACVPGCESLQATSENRFAVTVAVKVGPVAARFNGTIELGNVDPPNRYSMKFEARAGIAGFGKGTADVSLATVADGRCELTYSVDADVGGRIAQVGQRLVDGVARSMAKEFFTRFEQLLQTAAPTPPQDAMPAPVEAQRSRTNPRWLWVCIALAVALCAGVLLLK